MTPKLLISNLQCINYSINLQNCYLNSQRNFKKGKSENIVSKWPLEIYIIYKCFFSSVINKKRVYLWLILLSVYEKSMSNEFIFIF